MKKLGVIQTGLYWKADISAIVRRSGLLGVMLCGLLFSLTGGIISPAHAALSVDLTQTGLGAGVVGRGSAAVGSIDSVDAVFINPAGLSALSSWQVTTSVKSLPNVQGTIVTAAGGMPMGNIGTFGAAYINMSAPGGFETSKDANGNVVQGAAIGYTSSVMILSLARPTPFNIPLLNESSIGASLKLFNQNFSGGNFNNSGASGTGMNFDLGLMAYPRENIRVGFAIQNVLSSAQGGAINWNSGFSDAIPTAYKAGIAFGVRKDLWLMADSYYRPQQPSTFMVGGLWSPMRNLNIRMGVQQDLTSNGSSFQIDNNLTAGLGYTFAGFDFDYAYKRDSVLSQNTAHFFSISLEGLLNKLPRMGK